MVDFNEHLKDLLDLTSKKVLGREHTSGDLSPELEQIRRPYNQITPYDYVKNTGLENLSYTRGIRKPSGQNPQKNLFNFLKNSGSDAIGRIATIVGIEELGSSDVDGASKAQFLSGPDRLVHDTASYFSNQGVTAGDYCYFPWNRKFYRIFSVAADTIQFDGTPLSDSGFVASTYYDALILTLQPEKLYTVPGILGQEQTYFMMRPDSPPIINSGDYASDPHELEEYRLRPLMPYRKPVRIDAIFNEALGSEDLKENWDFQIVLFPDDGSGSPDLTKPIVEGPVVIDSEKSLDEQAMIVDHANGSVRFTVPPQPGDAINPTSITGQSLKLWAVYAVITPDPTHFSNGDVSGYSNIARGLTDYPAIDVESGLYDYPSYFQYDRNRKIWSLFSGSKYLDPNSEDQPVQGFEIGEMGRGKDNSPGFKLDHVNGRWEVRSKALDASEDITLFLSSGEDGVSQLGIGALQNGSKLSDFGYDESDDRWSLTSNLRLKKSLDAFTLQTLGSDNLDTFADPDMIRIYNSNCILALRNKGTYTAEIGLFHAADLDTNSVTLKDTITVPNAVSFVFANWNGYRLYVALSNGDIARYNILPTIYDAGATFSYVTTYTTIPYGYTVVEVKDIQYEGTPRPPSDPDPFGESFHRVLVSVIIDDAGDHKLTFGGVELQVGGGDYIPTTVFRTFGAVLTSDTDPVGQYIFVDGLSNDYSHEDNDHIYAITNNGVDWYTSTDFPDSTDFIVGYRDFESISNVIAQCYYDRVLYVVSSTALRVVDVPDDETYTFITRGSTTDGIETPIDITIDGPNSIVYILNSDSTVSIYDVSDPDTPTFLRTRPVNFSSTPRQIEFFDYTGNALALEQGDDNGGVVSLIGDETYLSTIDNLRSSSINTDVISTDLLESNDPTDILKLNVAKIMSGEFVTIGDGTNTFGHYNGTDETPFSDAVTKLPNGGTIFVFPGTYTFGSNVNLPNGVNLIGSDPNNCVIEIGYNGSCFTGLGDQSFKNLTFDLNYALTSIVSILQCSGDTIIENCVFKTTVTSITGACRHVEFSSVWNIVIRDCKFIDSSSYVRDIYVYYCNNVMIDNCTFAYSTGNPSQQGIYLENSNNVDVRNCYIDAEYASGGDWIFIYNCTMVNVLHNHAHTDFSDCFVELAGTCSDVNIIGNRCQYTASSTAINTLFSQANLTRVNISDNSFVTITFWGGTLSKVHIKSNDLRGLYDTSNIYVSASVTSAQEVFILDNDIYSAQDGSFGALSLRGTGVRDKFFIVGNRVQTTHYYAHGIEIGYDFDNTVIRGNDIRFVISNTSSFGGSGIYIKPESSSATTTMIIENNVVAGNYRYGMFLSSLRYGSVKDNEVSGWKEKGIYWENSSAEGFVIGNNVHSNVGSVTSGDLVAGLDILYQERMIVSDNQVHNLSHIGGGGSLYGIRAYFTEFTCEVKRNRLYDFTMSGTGETRCIDVDSGVVSSNHVSKITSTGGGSVYGLNVFPTGDTTHITDNFISQLSTASDGYGITIGISFGSVGMIVSGNKVQITETGSGTARGIAISFLASTTLLAITNNVCSAGPTGRALEFFGTLTNISDSICNSNIFNGSTSVYKGTGVVDMLFIGNWAQTISGGGSFADFAAGDGGHYHRES